MTPLNCTGAPVGWSLRLRSYRNNCRRNGWNACGAVKDEDDSGSWGFDTVAPTPLPPSQSPARPQPARKLGPPTPCVGGRGAILDLVEVEAELQD
ncbi:hypothetical protein Tco_1030271 [Tanacetum coccineum]|uniref:Uncharacterized protein n=1 Tax=Tanacetum coccineum TaxID=301880 RepID=A0ABQ5G5R1_9ASTR